jgi:adenine-specific DNA-methyltransferase
VVAHSTQPEGTRALTVSIILGDCRHVLRSHLRDESVHCVVTSPPYAIGKEYEGRGSVADWRVIQREVIRECWRALKPGGSLCWQVGFHVDNGSVTPLDAIIYQEFADIGATVRNRIVWTFGHGLHAKHRFSGRHETILWATKGEPAVFELDAVRIPSLYPNKRHYKGPKKGQLSGNPLGKNPGDVWAISNVKANHGEKTEHPCQFPEELVERLLLSLTAAGQTVLDPFAGSGTVGAVAQRLGRNATLIELNPAYVEIARKRLSDDAGMFAEVA